MSDSARYHAMANTERASAAGMRVEAPHVSLQGDTVMPESLITSIQPHYQVPHAIDLPLYFNYALRVAGPLLALGVNSPFFPPDLYDEGDRGGRPRRLLDGTPDQRLRDRPQRPLDWRGKVRFPRDLSTVEEAVDRVAADDTMVPMPVEAGERFDDRFPISGVNTAPTGGGFVRSSAVRPVPLPMRASSSGRSRPSRRSETPSRFSRPSPA